MVSNKTSDHMAIKNKFHEINNYIRNNIVLTKAQKLIFISSILICLKSDMDYIESYNLHHKTTQTITQKMIDTIQETFNDNCFTHQFEFIQTNVNSEHLIHVMTLVKESLSEFEEKENDVLNAFFREFTLWESNSEGKLGIVLTPNDIVQYMIQTLKIKSTDKVLDFCTGTSSFLVAASKYSKYVYGCEKDDINYTIAKCNFVLHDIPADHLVHSSCFDYPYTPTFDKIILNPPFACKCKDQKNLPNLEKLIPKDQLISWQEFTNEQRFVLYGIQLLKEGGKGSFIIPRSNFNNNTKKNNKFKEQILKHCQITSLITLSPKIFQPNASVQCSILNVIKTPVGLEKKISNVVDFTNDGFTIKKNVRVYVSKPEPKVQKRTLTINEDWNFVNETPFKPLTLREIRQYNFQYVTVENQKRINQDMPFIEKIPEYIPLSLSQNTTKFQTIKVKDYFKLINPEKRFQVQNSQEGPYPLISRSSTQNGIVKYIDDYSLQGLFITVAPSGSTGATFLQEGKFAVDGQLKILQPVKDLSKDNLHTIALILNKSLTSKYSYNNGLTNQKLLDEEIQIPLTPNIQSDQELQPECQTIKLEDYFELIVPEKRFQIQETQDGPYPLISSSGQNNGIVKYINEYSLDGRFITIARTGSAGSTFLQEGKFALTPDLLVLKPIDENITSEKLHLIAFVLNNHLLNKYSYNSKPTKQKILQEEIQIPVLQQQQQQNTPIIKQ